jgi:opacity protein-like surface antigen
MRKLLLLSVLVLGLAMPAAAQWGEAPAGEVFVGYSYLRLNPGENIDKINQHGWTGDLAINANRWLGVAANFSGHHRNVDLPSDNGLISTDTNVHTYLFGPRLSARGGAGEVFVHALFGGARLGGDIPSENAFAMALGGGFDIKAGQHFAIRAVQVDYVLTRFDSLAGSSQNHVRVSTGVVFRFGERW